MFKGVTNRTELKKLRNLLEAKLKENSTERIFVRYSSKAGISHEVEAYYSENHDLWWYFDGKDTQYWNPFGLGKPSDHEALTGRCQINMPISGHNGRIGGAFAYDGEGNLFLMHNGGIGGGVKGVSKKPFLDWYTGELFEVDFDGKKAEYFIVADFKSPYFIEDIQFFVERVYEFKILNKGHNAPNKPPSEDKWLKHGESVLRNPFKLPARTINRGAEHARITNVLIESLRTLGLEVQRNRFMDAFIVGKNGKISHLFEVKHVLSTQSLYTAIGQLMVYDLDHDAKLILVVDANTPPSLLRNLEKLGIESLTFKWIKKQPTFNDVQKFIGRF